MFFPRIGPRRGIALLDEAAQKGAALSGSPLLLSTDPAISVLRGLEHAN